MEYYVSLIKKKLSKKRFEHCINVSRECVKLAKKYNVDPYKAEMAGILHDITKEEPFKKQMNTIKHFGMIMTEYEKKSPSLWHPISGAAFLKYKLMIKDNDIINAVRYHTTGRPNMSMLEKIVFLSDAISIERNYKGVSYLRDLAYKDINEALAECVALNLKRLVELKLFIEPNSIMLYNEVIDDNIKSRIKKENNLNCRKI